MTTTALTVHRSGFPAEDHGWQFVALATVDGSQFYAYASTAADALAELDTVLPIPA